MTNAIQPKPWSILVTPLGKRMLDDVIIQFEEEIDRLKHEIPSLAAESRFTEGDYDGASAAVDQKKGTMRHLETVLGSYLPTQGKLFVPELDMSGKPETAQLGTAVTIRWDNGNPVVYMLTGLVMKTPLFDTFGANQPNGQIVRLGQYLLSGEAKEGMTIPAEFLNDPKEVGIITSISWGERLYMDMYIRGK